MFKNKTILITGGTGSWGNELTTYFLNNETVREIRIFSRGEYKQVAMKRKFGNNPKLRFIIGDVRDKDSLKLSLRKVNYVFHLAALKHVPICEENSWQTVLTNINGAQNVIEASIFNEVTKVIDVSTDKAVEPLNIYGITKACGEKLMINANSIANIKTRFVVIRAGNVIGTRGSIVPLFKEQIEKNNQITLTDENMTRFLINTGQAINLIIKATKLSLGGEIFVVKMPAATNKTLMTVLINKYGNSKTRIKKIGIRPGEKIDEVLISKNETYFTKELNHDLYVILPQGDSNNLMEKYTKYKSVQFNEYTSRNTRLLNEFEVEKLLAQEGRNHKL